VTDSALRVRTEALGEDAVPVLRVGCGLLVKVEDGVVVKVKGDPSTPRTSADVCAKAYTYRRSSGRATVCSTRSCARAGALPSSASLELALRFIAERFR